MLRYPQLFVLTLLVSGLISHAAVTPVRFYHLGEDDAGLGHNVVATNSLDSVSTNALSFTGAPKYWGHAARGNTNSHFSILFSTVDKATAAVVTNTDNVCFEAWANTGWRDYHLVAYNGDPTNNGYGFILTNNNYLAVLGGVGTVATIPCPPGEWMHLALVCSNGTVAVFTNRTLAAVTNATPVLPTGYLNIGGPNAMDPGYFGVNDIKSMDIKGFVDDVRISTFAPGAFRATDLLYAPPPQTQLSITRNGNKVVISVPPDKTLARLQSTTNLSSPIWQNVDVPETLATHNTWTNSLQGGARYYRLDPGAGIVPVVMTTDVLGGPPIPIPFGVGPMTPYNLVYRLFAADCGTVSGMYLPYGAIAHYGLLASDFNTFDASFSVDPLTETTNTLSFNWNVLVAYPQVGIAGAYFTGLADYYSPVLEIPPDALPDMPPSEYDSEADFWRATILMRHIPFTPHVPSQETVRAFKFYYWQSNYLPPYSIFNNIDPNIRMCPLP